MTGLEIALESDDATHLGLAQFEAIATTLKALIDKARVRRAQGHRQVDDTLEPRVPAGRRANIPGVDVAEIVARARRGGEPVRHR